MPDHYKHAMPGQGSREPDVLPRGLKRMETPKAGLPFPDEAYTPKPLSGADQLQMLGEAGRERLAKSEELLRFHLDEALRARAAGAPNLEFEAAAAEHAKNYRELRRAFQRQYVARERKWRRDAP